jgi:hypothetical protein
MIGENYNLQINITDRGEPGSNDGIAITLVNGSNALVYSSNWITNVTTELKLNSGNLKLSSQFNPLASMMGTSLVTEKVKNSGKSSAFSIKVSPSPSPNFFTLTIEGNSKETVVVKVFDMAGRQMEQMRTTIEKPIRFGEVLKPGTYILEVRQGEIVSVLKVQKIK